MDIFLNYIIRETINKRPVKESLWILLKDISFLISIKSRKNFAKYSKCILFTGIRENCDMYVAKRKKKKKNIYLKKYVVVIFIVRVISNITKRKVFVK